MLVVLLHTHQQQHQWVLRLAPISRSESDLVPVLLFTASSCLLSSANSIHHLIDEVADNNINNLYLLMISKCPNQSPQIQPPVRGHSWGVMNKINTEFRVCKVGLFCCGHLLTAAINWIYARPTTSTPFVCRIFCRHVIRTTVVCKYYWHLSFRSGMGFILRWVFQLAYDLVAVIKPLNSSICLANSHSLMNVSIEMEPNFYLITFLCMSVYWRRW